MLSQGHPFGPFERLGLTPGFTDTVAAALKRGRNGEGYDVCVSVPGHGMVELQPDDRTLINRAVNKAAGEEGPTEVARAIGNILRTKAVIEPSDTTLPD